MNKYFVRAKYIVDYREGINIAEFIVSAETSEEAEINCKKTYGWNCHMFEVIFCLNLDTAEDGCILRDAECYCKRNKIEDDEEEDEYL